jgi:ligand-binding sensor domain-containing protein
LPWLPGWLGGDAFVTAAQRELTPGSVTGITGHYRESDVLQSPGEVPEKGDRPVFATDVASCHADGFQNQLGKPMKHGTPPGNALRTALMGGLPGSWALILLCITCVCGRPPVGNTAAIGRMTDRPDADALASQGDEPVSQFVRRIHEDRRGHLWLGTNGDGVARWNGEALEYFSLAEGFSGVAVRGITEDADGNLWFGTEGGLTKFDGTSFVNYSERDGLASDEVWCLTFDRHGELWVGTLQGVSRFDGVKFTPFELPDGEPDPTNGVTSARMVRSITEDRSGRLWFGTNGGACVFDGHSLRNYSVADGLSNNNVNSILEDKSGRFWFATHHQGVCYLDGETFTSVTEADGVVGTEVWDLFMDRDGDIWFPVENSGIYRFNGKTFQRYGESEGLTTNAVQCTFQDRAGRLWFGGFRGLFRLEGEAMVAVTRDGPW